MDEQPARLGDLARVFFKIGAMSYGGPAIMGIMQNEIQERRRWLGKERFVEVCRQISTEMQSLSGEMKREIRGSIV